MISMVSGAFTFTVHTKVLQTGESRVQEFVACQFWKQEIQEQGGSGVVPVKGQEGHLPRAAFL